MHPLPTAYRSLRSAEAIRSDVEAVGRVEAVRTVLRVLARMTGLRAAMVARVTPEAWTCCAVLDEVGFGLKPGDTLPSGEMLCDTVRATRAPLRVNHASRDPRFQDHPALEQLGLESYVAVPLSWRDGTLFGVLCALDSRPSDLTDATLETFRHLAGLVGPQLEPAPPRS
jgi:GAF domain-containing protein